MATIAGMQFSADEFALRYTLETIEDVNFEIERVVAQLGGGHAVSLGDER